MAKSNLTIDKVLKDLYASCSEFPDKLAVAKEMVKLEMTRLKQTDDTGSDVPSALQD